MKNKKHKRNKFKSIITIIFFAIILILIINFQNNNFLLHEKNDLTTSKSKKSNYEIIKLDNNSKYSGIGQNKVENKDGYFTTFTTVNTYKKTYKEYKQNGISSWSNKNYWNGTMADNGCGITSLAIILSGYGKNYTPEDLRKKFYPRLNSDDISTTLSNTYGIANSDFLYASTYLSNDYIEEHLKTNRPILICVWNKPTDNRWTTSSHYLVLLATDENGMVYISNPNGLENDSKSSGWYKMEEITPYIAKALFINSYK